MKINRIKISVLLISLILIIVSLFIIQSKVTNNTVSDPASSSLFNNIEDNDNLPIGSGIPHGQGDAQNQLRIIKKISGKDLKVEDLPVSYTFYLIPDQYINIMLDNIFNAKNYLRVDKIKSNEDNWEVYDYSNNKFIPSYTNFSDAYQPTYVNTLILNKKTHKFIVIGKNIEFNNDLAFIKEIIRIFEDSDYYKNSYYQYLEISAVNKTPIGYEIQFSFSSLQSPYLIRAIWGVGILENNDWKMDYATKPTFKDFLKSIKGNDELEMRKRSLLDLYF
jgi:hypothetical protein